MRTDEPGTGLLIRRTWRRDGSTNLMSIGVAVPHIARATGCTWDEARAALLKGEAVETPHAVFRIDGLK